jgi:hypothetical protein
VRIDFSSVRKHWAFLVILCLAIVARIIFIIGQGFSNDELSGLIRTQHHSWNTFWYYGVTEGDMHPVFYQALLWFWVRIFGDSEIAVRAPGILFFIASQFLLYLICVKHVHKYAGIWLTACYAGLGFMIMNTSFARPYNSGVFFLILMLYAYMEMRNNEVINWKPTIWLTVGAIGALLSHYFAGLVAGVFMGFAFFMVSKKWKWHVTLSAVLTLLGFSLHASATIYQLSKGGLQWLSPPGIRWLPEVFWQISNESWLVIMLLTVYVFWLILCYAGKRLNPDGWALLVFFGLIILTGYLVSWLLTPVMRELVMLFMLPFPLLGFVHLVQWKEQKFTEWSFVLLSIIFCCHSFTYYDLLGNERFGVFREVAKEVEKAISEHGYKNITFASNFNNIAYLNYYLKKDIQEPIEDWSDPRSFRRMSHRIRHSNNNYFCYSVHSASDHPVFVEMIRRKFPYLSSSFLTKSSKCYVFSMVSGKAQNRKSICSIRKKNIVTDSSEFPFTYKLPVKNLRTRDKIGYYLFTCEGEGLLGKDIHLVSTLERKGTMIMRGEIPYFYVSSLQSEVVNGAGECYTAFRLPEDLEGDETLSLYVWNPKKLTTKVCSMSLFFVEK